MISNQQLDDSTKAVVGAIIAMGVVCFVAGGAITGLVVWLWRKQ